MMFLDRIVEQTRRDLLERKQELPLEEVRQQAYAQPEARDFLAALARPKSVQLIAEVKRASPSKGLLAPDLDPVATARIYEENGAAAISVLTEPHFFLGSPAYLTAIKQAVSIPVLRKDFLVDEYQVYEARSWGADAVLLICAILDDQQLAHLLETAHTLKMHCLVEVHTIQEARRAVAAGARIIGVNSRDLTTFEMHPTLLRDIRALLPRECVVVAESGIHSAADARRIARYDVQAMLVGESLVKSADIPASIQTLLQGANQQTQVKICGLKELEHIDTAIEAGADFLGFIFHEPSHRYVTPARVRQLVQASERLQKAAQGQPLPDLVGVFVKKDVSFINQVIEEAGLHFVQLYGNEDPELTLQLTRPLLKALSLTGADDLRQIERYQQSAWRLLIDTPMPEWGGGGQTHDWSLSAQASALTRIFLAGGLTPENVAESIATVHPWAVDVSSGVETDKRKDSQKIKAFIQEVRKKQQKENYYAKAGI
jgi:indole-3-glycerol phosphate synthase/phosphoribosylanthranilate isomerase